MVGTATGITRLATGRDFMRKFSMTDSWLISNRGVTAYTTSSEDQALQQQRANDPAPRIVRRPPYKQAHRKHHVR